MAESQSKRNGGGAIHEWLGYVALALIALQVVWSFVAHPVSRFARFADFVGTPAATHAYARQVLAHTEPRHARRECIARWIF